MARKTRTRSAWRKHFASVAKKCSKLARKGVISYRECMKKYL